MDRQRKKRSSGKNKNRLGAEQIILFIGLACFLVFLWLMAFFFLPMVRKRSVPAAVPGPAAAVTATPEFVLPPTWTPTPVTPVFPTQAPTNVALGLIPTPLYTPRPTSVPLSGLPLFLSPFKPQTLSVVDLARIMQGESPGDKEAAYMVGWVAKNRLLHPGYGDTYGLVSSGFFGYLAGVEPNEEFKEIARRVIRSRHDPTGGSLYALSRTDITNLGVPPARADVAYGEWFFFKTWPLTGR